MEDINVIKEEMEYIAMQNNPFTAIGGGLRYLCSLRNVEYSDNEPDNVIRDRLLEKIMEVKMTTKKQELIERITKMLEPYENIENYSFKINLYFKRDESLADNVQVSYNDYPYAVPQNIFV